MNDLPNQLGIVRVSAAGATFDIPYFDESEFTKLVFAVRATDAFDCNGIFIPYRAIDWMIKIPMERIDRTSTMGMTRQ